MGKGRDGQFDTGHASDLLGPQTASVDDVFAAHGALFRDHVPAFAGLLKLENAVVFDHRSAALLRGAGIRVYSAGGVDITFSIRPHAAQQAVSRHHRAQLAGFLGGHEANVFDAYALEGTVCGLQPLPAIRRPGHGQAPGHVHAHGLAALFLDFRQQVDGVGLKRGDVGVGV